AIFRASSLEPTELSTMRFSVMVSSARQQPAPGVKLTGLRRGTLPCGNALRQVQWTASGTNDDADQVWHFRMACGDRRGVHAAERDARGRRHRALCGWAEAAGRARDRGTRSAVHGRAAG